MFNPSISNVTQLYGNLKGKPYITVSSKGISNGLSDIINDGADFGPDTTLGATSPNQIGEPYSPTLGWNEALSYLIANGGGKLYVKKGIYDISNAPLLTNSYRPYKIGIPYVPFSGSVGNMIQIEIIGEGSGRYNNTLSENITKNDIQGGTVIWNNDTTNSGYSVFHVMSDSTGDRSAIFIKIDGISIYNNNGSIQYLDAFDFAFASSLIIGTIQAVVIQTPYSYSGPVSYTYISTGVTLPNEGTFYPVNIDFIHAVGYSVGVYLKGGGVQARIIQTDACWVGITGDGRNLSPIRIHLHISESEYTSIQFGDYSVSTLIVDEYTNNNQYSYSTTSLGTNIVATGQSKIIIKNAQLYNSTSPISWSQATPGQLIIKNAPFGISPSVSTPTVPASGTAQQNTYPVPVDAYLNGGAVTQVTRTVNGTSYTVFSSSSAVALSGLAVRLEPGDSITLTYTTAPTWTWAPA